MKRLILCLHIKQAIPAVYCYSLVWTIGGTVFNVVGYRVMARVTTTFHVIVRVCSWGFAGVLYSVWTQALR